MQPGSSNKKSSNFFQLSVTEFVLIIAFLFMILTSIFLTQGRSTQDDLDIIRGYIDQLTKDVNNLSSSFGLDPIQEEKPKEALTKVSDRIGEINSYIREPLELTNDEGTLVFTTDAERTRLEQEQKQLRQCAKEVDRQRKQCGTGYPICGGKGSFLANLALHDRYISVEILKEIEEVRPQLNSEKYTYQQFKDIADGYFDHSDSQILRCRYMVRVVDNTRSSSKEKYKAAIDAIDDRFYFPR